MQADRRLVEHVAHAHQPAADLRGEPDPLRFTAGKRAAGTVQRQIPDADVDHKPQSFADFAQNRIGDRRVVAAQVHRREDARRRVDAQLHDVVNVEVADPHGEALRPQPRTVARRARSLGEIRMQPILHRLAVGRFPAAIEVGNHALERMAERLLFVRFRAVNQDVAKLLRQRSIRRRGRHLKLLAEISHQLRVQRRHSATALAPRLNRPLLQRH